MSWGYRVTESRGRVLRYLADSGDMVLLVAPNDATLSPSRLEFVRMTDGKLVVYRYEGEAFWS